MAQSGLEPIVEGLVARMDEVVERCSEAIWETIPSYRRAGDDLRRQVNDAVRENVSTLAQVLRDGREATAHELDPIERVGARRAESGIPLEDLLAAYRMVARVCWDVLAEECRNYDGDAVEATIALARAVLRYTDQISITVAQSYAGAQRAIVREQEGARREFLAELLYGTTDAAPEDLLAQAQEFGYDLSLSYVALVGIGPGPEGDGGRETMLAAAASTAASSTADPIVIQKAHTTIALVPSEPFSDPLIMPEKLVAELGGEWQFGMGGPAPGLKGIRRAYLEAREALEIGTALGLGGPVYRFEELLLYHFLRVEPALLDRFVSRIIGPLKSYDECRKGEHVKTIEAYFHCDGSVKLAGEMLFAHPHTVTYRLKQVERLTGWSLRDPEDKLRLQLALRAHRLAQARHDTEEADLS